MLQRADFIYVADCKLATQENLSRLDGCGGRFVSVMPRTRKEDRDFRQRVRQNQVQWVHLLSRKNNRRPASKIDRYSLAQGQYQAAGFRLLWIRSTQKAEQDAETRTRHLNQTLEALRQLQTRLNTYQLKRRSAIEQALHKLLKEHHTQEWIGYQIQVHRQYQKRFPKRGRPKGCDPLPTPPRSCQLSWTPYFVLSFNVDRQALAEQSLTDGVFPLITNLEAASHPAKRVLEIYKFQPFLEKRHSQLKTWQELTPVLLKKDERVVAYLHMHVLALMVATLIERQLRRAMNQRSIPTLPLYPENRPCRYPTMFDIVRVFRGVERYEVVDGEHIILFPAALDQLQRQVLEFLDVPTSLYQ